MKDKIERLKPRESNRMPGKSNSSDNNKLVTDRKSVDSKWGLNNSMAKSNLFNFNSNKRIRKLLSSNNSARILSINLATNN